MAAVITGIISARPRASGNKPKDRAAHGALANTISRRAARQTTKPIKNVLRMPATSVNEPTINVISASKADQTPIVTPLVLSPKPRSWVSQSGSTCPELNL